MLVNSTGIGVAGAGLPVTGVRIGLIVVIGLIALVAGVVLIVLTRHRGDPATDQTRQKTG